MKGKSGDGGGPRPRRPAAVLKPRLRLVRDGAILLGPGKADRLDAARESIF